MRSLFEWLSCTHARLLLIAALIIVLSNVLVRRAQAQTCTAENGFPVDPTTLTPVCPPYKNPAVFFSPHADDETLGMGGAIARAVKQGRTVIVELMTVGAGQNGNAWYCNNDEQHANPSDDSAHPGPYRTCPTAEVLAESRVSEFLAAVKVLGATAVRIHRYGDGHLNAAQVKERAEFWIQRADPGLTLMGTAGRQDPDAHADHIAVYEGLKNTGFPETSFQKVYQYQEVKIPAGVVKLTAGECAQKHQALKEYRKWDPDNQRYAYGWLHSAGYLFTRASKSCDEFKVTSDSAFVAYPPYKAPLIDPSRVKKPPAPAPKSQSAR